MALVPDWPLLTAESWAGARVRARAVGAGVTRRNFAAPDIWTFVSLGIKG